jgi:hypothetical protein
MHKFAQIACGVICFHISSGLALSKCQMDPCRGVAAAGRDYFLEICDDGKDEIDFALLRLVVKCH